MDVEIDRVLREVGGYRRYHLGIFTLLGLSCFIPLCYQNLNIVFIGYEPPHHCKVPENRTINDTIPYTVNDQGEQVWEKCHMYANSSSDNTTIPCTDGWTYYSDGYQTIVTEWDLVCDNNYMVEMAQFLYQAVCLLAEIIVSYPVDRYGRKTIHIVSAVLVAFTGSAVAFSINYPMFLAMRSISAVLCVSNLLAGLTLVMELFDSDKRTFAGIWLEGGWMLAYVPLALFAWLLTDWRYLQFMLSIVNIVWIMYIWILHESVPWLAVTGKFKKADKVLNTTARWNGVKLSTPVSFCVEQDTEKILLNSEHDSSASIKQEARDVTLRDALELFKNPILRKHSIMAMVLWFANNLVYYEIILMTPTLPGDRFVNFFIIAIVELPAYFVSYFIIKRFGRRIPTCLFHIAAGLSLIIVIFIPTETASGVDLTVLSVGLVLLGKFCITVSFAIIILYTKEIFPTNLRGTSTGIGNVAGRLGNMVAPIIIYLAKLELYWLPSILCAVVSIVAGLLTLILPETNNKLLPQTAKDVIKLYHKKGQHLEAEVNL